MARKKRSARSGKACTENTVQCSLESIVRSDKGVDGPVSRVYVLSEVGYDTNYFNSSAYESLLGMMGEDKELSGILVDGAITRLDRPEYLNDLLTYWDRSEEECKQASEDIPNKEQYKTMMGIQLGIVGDRLRELQERVPQAKKIVFSLHSDDIQYTVSAMLNEMLVRRQAAIGESITRLKSKKKKKQQERKELQREYETVKGVRGEGRKRDSLNRKIDVRTRKIDGIEDTLQDLYQEQKLYREKRVRPAHQFFTKRFMTDLYSRYQELCDSLGIELVRDQTVLDFDGMKIDYSHSRHSTWNPIKSRDKGLVKSLHGKLDRLEGIDVVLESGHFGIGYKQLQKLKDSPAETNFKNQSSYDADTCDDHVTIVMALPFEDQKAIGEYVKGRKAVRMSGGKPMNTRKIAATDRYNNDGVSGITILTKDGRGIVGTEWIQYDSFVDGSAIVKPDSYSIICASSDEHMRSPESNPIVTDGWQLWYLRLLFEGGMFRGSPAFATGYINGGDVAEANSRRWQHRYHHKRRPEEVMRENLELLAKYRPGSVDDVVEMAMKMTNDAMGGSVESMQDVLESVAEYFEGFALSTVARSGLKWAHVCVTGNHADHVLRDLGLRETDFFKQRMKARGIGVYEAGMPDYHMRDPKGDKRIFIGGYSNARMANIEDYGLDTEGNALFGPVNLVVQHDPKGSNMVGTIGEGKNAGADLALSAHTHDNRMKLYRKDDNTFGVAYKLATLQGVSPTEKYYSYSHPRTQAAHEIVMPRQGDFGEKAIPVSHLAGLGRDALRERAEAGMERLESEDGRTKGM